MRPPNNARWRLCVFGYDVRLSVRRLTVAWRDSSVVIGRISMKLATNIHHVSGIAEKVWKLEVKGQGHDETECYNGGVKAHLFTAQVVGLYAVQYRRNKIQRSLHGLSYFSLVWSVEPDRGARIGSDQWKRTEPWCSVVDRWWCEATERRSLSDNVDDDRKTREKKSVVAGSSLSTVCQTTRCPSTSLQYATPVLQVASTSTVVA